MRVAAHAELLYERAACFFLHVSRFLSCSIRDTPADHPLTLNGLIYTLFEQYPTGTDLLLGLRLEIGPSQGQAHQPIHIVILGVLGLGP